MSLPKIDLPLFDLKLPSNGKKVKFRPFTVKEEKILLIAQETKDIEQAVLAVKQVINNCVFGVNIEEMNMLDLEFILLNLRAKSVDNNVRFSIRDPETDEKISLSLDLDNIKVIRNKNHTNEIKINGEYVLYLRYPTINEFLILSKSKTSKIQASYDVMISCLDKLASNDSVYKFNEFTKEEVDAFVQDLTGDVIQKIKTFFDTMPKLRHEIKYKNKNGNEKTFVVEGIESFFI